MIFFRAAILAIVVGLVVVALTQTATRPAPQPATPTPASTRAPLPTLAPEVIISRVSRETPAPQPRPTPPAQPRVAVVDYGYTPQQLILRVGASVTWTNDGNDGHDVTGTGPGGDWRSGPLAPSERYTRQFNLAGTYAYTCTFHPEMHGQIVVES